MASVDNELALWSGTSGTVLKRSIGTGTVRVASGVMSLGDAAMMPWISGQYYDGNQATAAGAWTGGINTALRLYASPIYVPNDVTLSEIGINVTTFQATALARLGIYSLGSDFKPGALFWEGASTLDCSTNGDKAFTGLTLAVPGGRWYYSALIINVASVQTWEMQSPNSAVFGYNSHSSTTRLTMYYLDRGTHTLPNPFGTPTNITQGMKRVTLRVA